MGSGLVAESQNRRLVAASAKQLVAGPLAGSLAGGERGDRVAPREEAAADAGALRASGASVLALVTIVSHRLGRSFLSRRHQPHTLPLALSTEAACTAPAATTRKSSLISALSPSLSLSQKMTCLLHCRTCVSLLDILF